VVEYIGCQGARIFCLILFSLTVSKQRINFDFAFNTNCFLNQLTLSPNLDSFLFYTFIYLFQTKQQKRVIFKIFEAHEYNQVRASFFSHFCLLFINNVSKSKIKAKAVCLFSLFSNKKRKCHLFLFIAQCFSRLSRSINSNLKYHW